MLVYIVVSDVKRWKSDGGWAGLTIHPVSLDCNPPAVLHTCSSPSAKPNDPVNRRPVARVPKPRSRARADLVDRYWIGPLGHLGCQSPVALRTPRMGPSPFGLVRFGGNGLLLLGAARVAVPAFCDTPVGAVGKGVPAPLRADEDDPLSRPGRTGRAWTAT